MNRSIDTKARLAAKQRFEKELWLYPRILTALMCWVGLSLTDPYAARIRRAVAAGATTARYAKTHERDTKFARAMRLRDRLNPADPHAEATINATSMLVIAANPIYVQKTRTHVGSNDRLNHNRVVDMNTFQRFMDDVTTKFLHSAVWPGELLTIETFAILDLLPDELLTVDDSYRRLVKLVQAVAKKPMLGAVTGFQEEYQLTPVQEIENYHKRRRLLMIGDFCDIMHRMSTFSKATADDIASAAKVPWTPEDWQLMAEMATQLEARMQ